MSGELTIRATIWSAMALYAFSVAARSRCAYVAGLITYLAHVLVVFHFAHGWSHTAAYEYTSVRTAEVCGITFGGGLYVNYTFTLLWLADAGWWWLVPATYLTRPRWLGLLVHSIFVFMIFNATVVFGS